MRRSHGLECFTDLAHHPLAYGAEHFSLKSFLLLHAEQGRKLDHPRGRMLRQSLQRRGVVGRADQLPDRFEHRIVGLLSPEHLEALSAGNPAVGPQRRTLLKCIDECSLSGACLTREEEDLPNPLQRPLQTVVELRACRLATHNPCRAAVSRFRSNWHAFIVHRRYEFVAALVHGLDEHRVVAAITEDLADSEDVLLDEFRVHVRLRPQRLEDLVLGNDSIRVIDQIAKQIERLWPKRYALLPTPQAVVDGVEPK